MQLQSSLFQNLKSMGMDTGDTVMMRCATVLIRHIMMVCDSYECQRELNAAFDFKGAGISAQQFRLMLADSGYIHLNLKFFCLNLIKKGASPKNIDNCAETFNISRNDAVLVKKVFKQKGFQSSVKKHEAIQNLEMEDINRSSFLLVYEQFNVVHPILMKHIKNKTYTKLRFISVSSNVEFYDFHMELICKAFQTYIHKLVPGKYSDAYVTNYIKRALSNHIVNIIKSYDTQKRRRMQQSGKDGFGGFRYEVPVISENQLYHAFGVENMIYENMRNSDINSEEEAETEGNISFRMIMEKFGFTKKRRLFIYLMAQQEHFGFTSFLQKNNLIEKSEDNIDYYTYAGNEDYFNQVCQYLQVGTNSASKFIRRVGKKITP